MKPGPSKGATHKKNGEPIAKKGPRKGHKMKISMARVPGLLDRMQKDHLDGMTWVKLGEKYGYKDSNIISMFKRRGMTIIERRNSSYFPKTMKRHTRAEIRAIVAGRQRFFSVPKELRLEWREEWDLKARSWFIRLMVKKHGWPYARPKGKFSANVQPFDYTTPAAHAVIARRNAGVPSRNWHTRLKPFSQGVIFEDTLWTWVEGDGYVHGSFVKSRGRERLHRLLYERHHGPIPPRGVVRMRDGNPNNLDPANLYLATQDDVARENQASHYQKQSRQKMAALLKLNTQTHHETARFFRRDRGRGRNQTKAA